MKYYQEITLLPGTELTESFLMGKVFMQIHIAIAECKREHPDFWFGISFPKYTPKGLGGKIRVFSASLENMESLRLPVFLQRLCDYVHIIRPRLVPEAKVSGYARYKRYRQQDCNDNLARRYAKRHGVTFEEAIGKYAARQEEDCKLPYILMRSLSTGQKFSLFIEKKDSEDTEECIFDSYGLSKKSALPVF